MIFIFVLIIEKFKKMFRILYELDELLGVKNYDFSSVQHILLLPIFWYKVPPVQYLLPERVVCKIRFIFFFVYVYTHKEQRSFWHFL